jgi:hypothetical protein
MPHVEVAGRTLVEAVHHAVTDADLAGMNLRDSLQWAADADGRLTRRDLLERLARVRGYDLRWVNYQLGRSWREAWEAARDYAKAQQAKANGNRPP